MNLPPAALLAPIIIRILIIVNTVYKKQLRYFIQVLTFVLLCAMLVKAERHCKMRMELMGSEVITIEEAAEFLKTGKPYIFKMVREGELPVIRRGKRYTRLMKSDLIAFLQRCRREAITAKEVQR